MTYKVVIKQTEYLEYTVEADSKAGAEDKAIEESNNGGNGISIELEVDIHSITKVQEAK